ncbi:VIR protein [Plasmodium vivax]|uniref:VIR protein n=1 Tax=Plasmodium vivax TaxID=5855 RepID=A0A1G4GSF3_PLAVI|nr:VIR protein [Plasmodium vivax]
MGKTDEQILEEVLNELKLGEIYEDVFDDKKTSKYETHCSALASHDKQYVGAKALCNKYVRALEKISELNKNQAYYDRCKYVPYWLYGEIGKIYNNHKVNIEKIPFVNDLINVEKKVNGLITKNKCNVLYNNLVHLDELIKRKHSYIYFKKYDTFKNTTKWSSKCKEYFIYLDYINSFYNKFKSDNCTGLLTLFSSDPDFFSCNNAHNPNTILSKIQECKPVGFKSRVSSVVAAPPPVRAAVAEKSPKVTVGAGGGQKGDKGASLSQTARDTRPANQGSDRPTVLVAGGPPAVRTNPVEASRVESRAVSPNQNLGLTVDKSGEETVFPPSTFHLAAPEGALPSSSFVDTTYDILNSEYFRHSIVAASIIGVLVFLYFFLKSTSISSRTRRKKKRESENNYYEEYEENEEYEDGLSRYDSGHSFSDSQMSEMNLSYQPRRESYY